MPFPGMVRRRLVGAAVELNSLGLFDGGVDAFLIVQGDGWFAFAEDAVRQRPPLVDVEQDHRAVEGPADGDLGTSEAITLALSRELILPVLLLEGEVLRELALSMQAEDPVEFLWIVQHGAMRVGGVLRGYGEAQVVIAQEKPGRKALAASMSEMPARRSSLTRRSCKVWFCGVLAWMGSMSMVLRARVNWVSSPS